MRIAYRGIGTVFWTTKSKRTTPERLELRNYDKKLRRYAIFKEAR